MQHHSLYSIKRFSLPRVLALPVAIVSFCGLALLQSQGQTTIIQNFDGFADTTALNAAISGVTPNATITLSGTGGVGGSQAMVFQGACGTSPYYAQFSLNVTPFSLSGLTDVTLQIEGAAGISQEYFTAELLENGTSIATGPKDYTQSFSTGSFDTYDIAFSGQSATIDAIRCTFVPDSYGNTQLTIDNIATVGSVPEPASLALSGLGLAAFLLRRRRK